MAATTKLQRLLGALSGEGKHDAGLLNELSNPESDASKLLCGIQQLAKDARSVDAYGMDAEFGAYVDRMKKYRTRQVAASLKAREGPHVMEGPASEEQDGKLRAIREAGKDSPRSMLREKRARTIQAWLFFASAAAAVFAAIFLRPLFQHADEFAVVFKDSLDGPVLNQEHWRVRRPQVIMDNGVLRLKDRGYLVTAAEFPKGVSVRFRWQWIQGEGEYCDILSVAVRTSGVPDKWPHEVEDGIVVKFEPNQGTANSGFVRITDRSQPRELAIRKGLVISKFVWHEIKVTDDGNTIAVYFGDDSVPVATVDVPDAAKHHHVAIYNREPVADVSKESLLSEAVFGAPLR